MNKKIIRTISWILIFLFINQGYMVKAAPTYPNDGPWIIISRDSAYPADKDKLQTNSISVSALGKDLNNLITALIASGEKHIYVKDGEYNLNGTLFINNSDVIILGESKTGTKIIQTQNAVSIKVNDNDVEVANLNIDGSGGKEVFHAQHVDGAKLTNCIIKGSDASPAVAIFGTDVIMNSNIKIQGNTIYFENGLPSSFGQAIIYLNQNNGEVSDNNVSGGSMDFEVCYDLIVDGNNVENSPKGGIKVLLPGENIKILNNTTKNTYNSGIAVVAPSSNNNRYQGIEVKNNNITNTKYFGIEINNLDGGIIEDNKIGEIDFYGMYILKSDNLNIENNQILNCELYNGSAPRWTSSIRSSIYLEIEVQDSKIKNNLIHNDNTNPCEYGIKIQSGQQNNNILNNTISGNFVEYISANIVAPDYTNIIAVENVTQSSITIKWQRLNATAEYEVKVDENSIPVDVGTSDNYQSTGLDSNSTHKYMIRKKGDVQWSGFITLTTIPSPPPVVIPQNINTSATENSIKISWDEASVTSEYEVEVDGSLIAVDVGSNESYEHTGLLNDTTHNYRIRIKGEQWSGFITSVTLSSQSPIGIIPQNIKASTTESSILISWGEVDDTTEYEVEVDGNPVVIDVGTDERYEHTGLKSNSTYSYRVRIKGGQWSAAIITKTKKLSNVKSSSNRTKFKSINSKSDNDISNEYDKIEMNFGKRIILIYQNKLIQNTQDDQLKRMILYTVEEKHYVKIRAWKNNQIKINTEYELNSIPGPVFKIDEIKSIAIDTNDQIETILVPDMDGYINFMYTIENSGLSKYVIENGYIFSNDDLGMKLQINQKSTKITD